MTQTLRIPLVDDYHLHLRDGQTLKDVVRYLHGLRYVTVMPNPSAYGMPGDDEPKGILNIRDVQAYTAEISAALDVADLKPRPAPLVTLKVTPYTTPADIRSAYYLGLRAAKLYPDGVTHNSTHGVRDLRPLYAVFRMLSDVGMLLLVHGEKPGAYSADAERLFHSALRKVAREFPDLKIVFEHITDRRTIDFVRSFPNMAATVTLHHMLIQHDDVAGRGKMHPHNFCMPLAKRPQDRDALLEFATSGDPQCFLGTDSAPHVKEKKECAKCCAGVFTGPITIPLLVEVFEQAGRLQNLRAFACENGAHFYGLPPSTEERIELIRKPWTIPTDYDGIVPFKAGETLNWQIARYL